MGRQTRSRRNGDDNYSAADIQVLEGLEAVRRRPGMYIGTTDVRGLHHLVYEIVDNAVDEAMAGFCDRVDVVLHRNGSVTVRDNGRGIPVGRHEKTGLSAVETVLTTLHAGGKFGGGGYKVSGGLHGVGASVVNALSEWLEVEVATDGGLHRQSYRRGAAASKLAKVSRARPEGSGTTIRFLPDTEIFESLIFEFDDLAARFREMAYLTAGLQITLRDERPDDGPRKERWRFDSGIEAYVRHINSNLEPLHRSPIVLREEREGVEVEVALQYNESFIDRSHSFANCIRTIDGGSHLTGFRAALTRVVNEYVRGTRLLKDGDPRLGGEEVREGLTAVVSVRLAEPQFEGQTKTRLGNPEIKGIVESVVGTQLAQALAESPSIARRIAEKAVTAARARAAARKARELVQRKSFLESTTLPGKLSDCAGAAPEDAELYLVEGDSAGGTARSARDRATQAILPLRGKILNVEKPRPEKAFEHTEIQAIVTAIGAGFGVDYDPTKLRYHKIIIMTDADVDGAHIRTLLLTFFWRYMPDLVRGGHLCIAQPPLFSVTRRRADANWLFSEEERAQFAAEHPDLLAAGRLQRYKGLGEMNADQLWDTTMDPERRALLRVGVRDEGDADEIFSCLMGDAVAPRREFIMTHALDASVDA